MPKLRVFEGGGSRCVKTDTGMEEDSQLKRTLRLIEEGRCQAVRAAIWSLAMSRGVERTVAFVNEELEVLREKVT